jgi:hypothetical protein
LVLSEVSTQPINVAGADVDILKQASD